MRYDVIVVGLGAMGSAAAYQLAKRGARVLGIDRYAPPHDLGSSHGETRITRLAIGEGEHLTPLVRRSHEIWRAIEGETGADLLTQCGELIISSQNKTAFTHVEGFFEKTLAAAQRFGIPHRLLNSGEIRKQFPAFDVREDEYGYFEPDAGFVRPEAAIAAQLDLAQVHGTEIHCNERVTAIDPLPHEVIVTTDRGIYKADTAILAAGAWLPHFLGADFLRFFRIYRQVLTWFAIERVPSLFAPNQFPVFIWELPDGQQGIYGIPSVDGTTLKIATEQYTQTTLPDESNRIMSADEIGAMYRQFVAPYLRGVSARCTRTATCLYTVTPDAGFIIDRLPASDRVIIASCCSGHGFKHSPAIGEILADMVQGTAPAFDIAPFRLGRFS